MKKMLLCVRGREEGKRREEGRVDVIMLLLSVGRRRGWGWRHLVPGKGSSGDLARALLSPPSPCPCPDASRSLRVLLLWAMARSMLSLTPSSEPIVTFTLPPIPSLPIATPVATTPLLPFIPPPILPSITPLPLTPPLTLPLALALPAME